jgi:DNA mismatch repair protein MutL
MSKIRVLPEALANKIAAGEVVERPASVVKELLENAIDAGASSIEIEIEGGGKRLVRIQDNGEGMSPDDALLAFERHATSKLLRAEDLIEISTLGFRGEALPSIASVSRLILETRHESSPVGTSVEIHGARMAAVKEIARPLGSSVTVRDLFFNLPARKKFLKSDSTELSHIVNVTTQYAVAHPEARFLLKSSGVELFCFQPVAQLRERVFQVFGGELLKQLIEIQNQVPIYSQDDEDLEDSSGQASWVRVQGFASKPEVRKLNRNSLHFFVNRRMVRDRIILHAVGEAYRNILPADVFPVVLLFLEMPYREVDVNVHPSKTEVRFRRQALVHDFLRDAIRKALMEARPQAPFAARSSKGKTEWESPFDTPPVESLNLAGAPSGKEVQSPAAGQPQDDLRAPSVVSVQTEATNPLILTPPQQIPSSSRLPFNPDEGLSVTAEQPAETGIAWTQQAAASGQTVEGGEPGLHDTVPLGQIENSFIVAADRGALLIIDQHVAHERVLFERVLRQRSEGRVESQRLLLPIIVELTPRQQVILESITPELVACGFEVEPFGRKTIAVKAAPADLTSTEIEHLLNELLESLEKETQVINLPRLREKIAASIACHAAIKVNTPLEHSKMVWLIDQLMKTQFPMTCPHGRPIILRYEKNEILRAFKRI